MSTELQLEIIKFIISKNTSPRNQVSLEEISKHIKVNKNILEETLAYLCKNGNGYLNGLNSSYYIGGVCVGLENNLEKIKLFLETPSEDKTIEWILSHK